MSVKVTEPQLKALRVLAEVTHPYEAYRWVAPRAVAHRLWPDSPAWERRTNMHRGMNGAVGGTMPMVAATMLWRLEGKGLASVDGEYHNHWRITDRGLRVVEERS